MFVKDPEPVDSRDERSMIGVGSFGNTHVMKNSEDRGVYAVKEIRVAAVCQKFNKNANDLLEEVYFLQQLNHPYIVRYFTCYFSIDKSIFNVVMEFVRGGTIEDRMKNFSVSTPQIVTWWTQLASALYYMHNLKIQHRDIKPKNIAITLQNNVKIIDMGLARSFDDSKRETAEGTPFYFSYEKAMELPYDGRDDVWATGCVIAELMTKRRLQDTGGAIYFPAGNMNDRRLQLISDCEAVDARYGGIIRGMLEPEQDNRCNSEELVKTLCVYLNSSIDVNLFGHTDWIWCVTPTNRSASIVTTSLDNIVQSWYK